MYSKLYHYRARFLRYYDGDTITKCEIDTGFGVRLIQQRIRLNGVNAPEIRNTAAKRLTDEERAIAKAAKDRLRELTQGKTTFIKTYKTSKNNAIDKYGKYGRWICEILVPAEELEGYFPETIPINSGWEDVFEYDEFGKYYNIIKVLLYEGHVTRANY